MGYTPLNNSRSLLPQYTFNQQQCTTIVDGLKPGHYLAYDTQTQQFVTLNRRSEDRRYVQNLDELSERINTFLGEAQKFGLSKEEIWNVQRAALARGEKLQKKIKGVRGLFKSERTKETLRESCSALNRVAKVVDNWVFNYLDEYNLVREIDKGSDRPKANSPVFREWFVNQALFLEHMKQADPETRNRLALLMLHGYSKAATVRTDRAERLGIQSSPVTPHSYNYYRTCSNTFLVKVSHAYAQDMGIDSLDITLVDSALFREVIARKMPYDEIDLKVSSLEEFDQKLDAIL